MSHDLYVSERTTNQRIYFLFPFREQCEMFVFSTTQNLIENPN
jgi:hypothetical protein